MSSTKHWRISRKESKWRCADTSDSICRWSSYISHIVRGLQVIMDVLQDTSEKYNMRITKKTKIMRMSTVKLAESQCGPWADHFLGPFTSPPLSPPVPSASPPSSPPSPAKKRPPQKRKSGGFSHGKICWNLDRRRWGFLHFGRVNLLLLVCVSFTIIGQPWNSVLIRRV